MNWLYKLERRFGRFGISNLMLYVVTTMLFVAIFDMVIGFPLSYWFSLIPSLVAQGQIWRLITFIFLPPSSSPLALVLSLYFYYIMGSALERVWGTFRFNLYYLFGIIGCILAGLISGYGTEIVMNQDSTTAYVNGVKETLDTSPLSVKYVKAGETKILVPARFTTEALGFGYMWNASKKRAEITKPFQLYYDDTWSTYDDVQGKVTINGARISLGKMPAITINNCVMVPSKKVFAAEEARKNGTIIDMDEYEARM